ncbi:MAG: deoxyguanosinetriphosphate triphosphohydrolase [Alphaproteobacteria bacterium]|nr:deoxyguanosinetriphosphate triphosphohydrolase [Alphaproteobacteria bacterium]
MSLAKYAVTAENSRGRMFKDYDNVNRSEFQRDRDRIIHSGAFRRLEGKTQVFAYHEGKSYRTRLTHSIEVAQIARTICKSLKLNEELSEALALAHDIGHAPFGHAGERGLNKAMKNFGGFDHNIHSLKIMCETETHYPNFKGLNLTWETLEGTIKHNGAIKKIADEWLKAFNKKFPLDLKKLPSMEAQIASLSDDIAYNNHDIDDGFRAGFFSINQLRELDFVDDIIAKFDYENPYASDELRIYAITRSLIGEMVYDILDETKKNLHKLNINSLDDVRQAKCFVADFSPLMHRHIKKLHEFLCEHFYNHSNIARMDRKSQCIVEELFAAFMNDERLLPDKQRRMMDKNMSDKAKADIICSYIADMTDAFACEEHQKLFNVSYRF